MRLKFLNNYRLISRLTRYPLIFHIKTFHNTINTRTDIDVVCRCVHEEMKSSLNSGNACYHSVQNLMSSSLSSKNIKVKMYAIITVPVVITRCEIWPLTLREVHKLRVFENWVLGKIFGGLSGSRN